MMDNQMPRPPLPPPGFSMKIFVKATEPDDLDVKSKPKDNNGISTEKGKELKKFYDELISEKKIKSQSVTKVETKPDPDDSNVICIDDSDDDVIFVVESPDVLFKELVHQIENVNLDRIKEILNFNQNDVIHKVLETEDNFGWSPLMIAAALEDNRGYDIVKLLLHNKANVFAKDKKGRDCRVIAQLKGNVKVESYLAKVVEGSGADVELVNLDDDDVVEHHCDVCGTSVPVGKRTHHLGSVSHQLAAAEKKRLEGGDSQQPVNPGFAIGGSNRGFQLMLKSGWDGVSGLGCGIGRRADSSENDDVDDDDDGGGDSETREGKGRLFPVKSVFKTDRRGLAEGDRKAARITHFAANDVNSVKRTKLPKQRVDSSSSNTCVNGAVKQSNYKRKQNQRRNESTSKEKEIRLELFDLQP